MPCLKQKGFCKSNTRRRARTGRAAYATGGALPCAKMTEFKDITTAKMPAIPLFFST
jgi:hypothetical protein